RQHQDGDEGQEDHPEHLAGKQGAQVWVGPEVPQHQVENPIDGEPEQRPHGHEQQQLARAAARAFLADALQRGPPLGLEHTPQRRLGHGAPSPPPPWPSTSASSRTWTPPVSFRNSSSRLASPARCCRRRSSTVPSATILPCWMIATRSHIASATSSVWVLMSTVPPRLANWRKMSFSSRAAFGSSPTIGSSTTMYSGRWINALEMISFWRIPWLYASTSSSFQLASSNTSSSSAIRRPTASPSWPYRAATNRRNSAPVSLSYTNGRSGMKPSRCLAAIGLACTSSPPNDTRPSVGRRMPAIMRSVVVFPATLGPRNPYSTPRGPRQRHIQHGVLVAVAIPRLEHPHCPGRPPDHPRRDLLGHPIVDQAGGAGRVVLATDDLAGLSPDACVVAFDPRLGREERR